jgi:ankyrin repeat protein
MFGDVRKVEWMLQQGGANPNATDSDGWTPLHEALTQNPLHDAVLKLLLRHGANPNAAAKDGWTPLHEACKNGNAPIVALLLGKKAYPNVTKLDGWTPLHEACSNGHDSVVELLLNHKANPNATDYDGRSPLHVACKHAHTSIIKTLLNYGANSNATNKIGSTPLHEACKSGNEEIAALLLKHEAQPTCQTIQWWTPLHEASKNGSRAVVALLLEHEADINAVNKDGLTARHLALLNKKNSVVDLFSANRDNSGRAVRLPESQSANIGRWRCRNPLIECVAGLEKRTAKTLRKILPKKVTALDKLLREMREDAGDIFCVYTGTLDAMTDDLVVKARSSGISLDEVTHAMFACKESRTWLHNLLLERLLMSETLVTEVVSLLCFGKNMDHCLFTDAVLYFNDESFRVIGSNREHESLNLSEYTEVPSLHVEQVRMKAHKHLNGVYQLVGERIVCALVPHKDGVKYFLRNDCADFVKETKLVDQLGTGPCRAQDTVEELVAWGCDKVLAWKLLTCSQLPNHPPLDDICDQLVQSFKVISNFRMQLKMAINAPREGEATRLLGSKNELRQSRQDVDERFAVNRRVYNTAQRKCGLGNDEPLEPFSSEFLEQDASKTHMKLLSKLIERAKKSDVNTGKTKHKQSYFDARIVAFLGALNGGQVSSSLVSKYARTQYCYQDDGDTKGLCTPFSNLVVIATTGCQYIKIPEQVQSLPNAKHSLNNWVALRAAFEFDSEKGIFRYNTPEFQHANKLIKRSLVDFILDVSRRFSEVFEASPDRVYVSHLERLCDKIAELSGASSAWLLREMVSRYIKKGARVESSGRMPKDGYGRVETEICQAHYRHPASTKFIYFDRDVNIEGVLCRVSTLGKVFAREIRSARRVELRFRDGQNAPDYETAKMWLKQGMCKHIVLSDTEWSLGHHHVVETNFV